MLSKNNFEHGFFTKTSSQSDLSLLTSSLNLNQNCFLKQIHSNKIVFGSKAVNGIRSEGDGIICDKNNQNLWIYTADCMPILFADKTKRMVAAVHCGRKGLENKIIKNILKTFHNLGSLTEDIIVAIGPSISKEKYLIDNKTFQEFYKKTQYEDSSSSTILKTSYHLSNFAQIENQLLIPLDLKHTAHNQLLNENILDKNIDISTICTYESKDDFYSWRRSKTSLRQWSFISG